MGTAAFFRLEGPLSSRPSVACAAYLAANAQEITERIARLSGVMAAAPFGFAKGLLDPVVRMRMAYAGLRGMSEDRLVVLGEEYADRYVVPKLHPLGVDLVAKAKARGHEVVLLSDNLDVVVRRVARHLGVETFVANGLELRDGKVTGRLRDPVIHGTTAFEWARDFAKERGIDLGASLGYAGHQEDGLLLSALGKPCAVAPDIGLRRMARDLDWPVLER